MEQLDRFNLLREDGRIAWKRAERGWRAEPDEILAALSADGFYECKRDVLRAGGRRAPTGGIWQGVHERTGAVASALWVSRPDDHETIVFVAINGTPLRGDRHGRLVDRAG